MGNSGGEPGEVANDFLSRIPAFRRGFCGRTILVPRQHPLPDVERVAPRSFAGRGLFEKLSLRFD